MYKWIYKVVCLLMPLTFPAFACDSERPPNSSDGQADTTTSVNFIDVGAAESTFIRLPDGKTVLIDVADGDGVKEVIDFLDENSVDKIDYLFITHPEVEHVGGGLEILEEFTVSTVYHPNVSEHSEKLFPTYMEFMTKVKDAKIDAKIANVRVSVSTDDYFLAVLSPEQTDELCREFNGAISPTEEQTDNISTIIYLKIYQTRFLFTSDARYKAEEKVAYNYKNHIYNAYYGDDIVVLDDLDYLKVSNGGADGSSGNVLLSVLKPKNAIISTSGTKPPSNLVLNRLYKYNDLFTLLRTDVFGTISVNFDRDGKGFVVQ